MATEPQPPLSEAEKRRAFLAELEAERQRRVDAGTWSKSAWRPVLTAILPPNESLQTAQQRALYAYLAEHPDAPKTIAAYDWLVVEIVEPEPVVELPLEPSQADTTPSPMTMKWGPSLS